MTRSPEDIARSLDTIGALRGGLAGFEVAVMGHADQASPLGYARAGATWWLENIHDGRGSFDEMRALVRAGPPG